GLAPRDEAEALLVTQMVATHWLALSVAGKVGRVNNRPHLQDIGNLTVKLMRTFTAQVETLQRLRGKASEQKVTVEHVHIHPGGQAIVGAVTTGGTPGVSGKVEEQPMQSKLPMHLSPRCGARTRRLTQCQSPAMPNGRCRMHGGKSTGAPKKNR